MRLFRDPVAIDPLSAAIVSPSPAAVTGPRSRLLCLLALVLVVVAGCGRDDPEAGSETITAEQEAAFERSVQRATIERPAPNPAVHDFGRHRRAQETEPEAAEDEQ